MSANTNESDPFSAPIIFLRIGWMDRYQGQTANDHITGGGAFVEEHGYGHEIFNFQDANGRVYGYVQPTGSGHNQPRGPGIRIERLGASSGDDSMPGVLAIWVAAAPMGGSYIVGWYANATVHRHWQQPPLEANRRHASQDFGFYVTAASDDAVLLPPDERLFPIPRGQGGMGQSNVWYADEPVKHREIRTSVSEYIATQRLPRPGGSARQLNPLLRQEIERAAVATTTKYYRDLGYEVDSVESDNVGWDLDAVHAKRHLRIEVKGLSGAEVRVELTPNEYQKLQAHRDSYRICVVTNALSAPALSVFKYSQDAQRWEDRDGRVLEFKEVVAARCSSSS